MNGRKLTRIFFARPTLTVAKELLGKFLVRKIGGKIIKAIITETEAYKGPKDLASHASRGRTKRTEIMFGPPGFAYIYLIYGMYYCLNIVTETEGYPAAVLIRGAAVLNPKLQTTLVAERSSLWGTPSYELLTNLDGPGKLCRFLKIDKALNGEDITRSGELWLEDKGVKINETGVKTAKRIGVDYAGQYKDKLWRFLLKKLNPRFISVLV